MCPLLLFAVVAGLECQTPQSMLMVVFLLCLICVVIRDDQMILVKGSKRS